MKKKPGAMPSSNQDKAGLIMHNAQELMSVYAKATGAFICVLDHNYMPIPGLFEEITTKRNTCLFCIKYKKNIVVKSCWDLCANPCREMHINSIKESYRFGGSYTYICPLGFMFWTSPIYLDGQFTGALIGSGILGVDIEDVYTRMHAVCGGDIGEAELKQMLSSFSLGEPGKIKSMTELMLVCAKSLSRKRRLPRNHEAPG